MTTVSINPATDLLSVVPANKIPTGTYFMGQLKSSRSENVLLGVNTELYVMLYGPRIMRVDDPSQTWDNVDKLTIHDYVEVDVSISTTPCA